MPSDKSNVPCIIRGLTRRPELNGKICIPLRSQEDSRWHARVVCTGAIISIHDTNLRVATPVATWSPTVEGSGA